MRILHVTSFYEPAYRMGGRAMVTASLAKGQARAGADVSVFTTTAGLHGRTNRGPREDRDGVRVYYYPTRPSTRAFLSWGLLKACRSRTHEFDIVHVHGLWSFPDTCGAWAARRANVPYVLSPHGSLTPWARQYRAYKKRPYWWAVERRTVLGSRSLHFTTPEEADQTRPWIAGHPTVVIPPIVETPPSVDPQQACEWRQRLGVPPDMRLVGFLGRIHPAKGLELLVDATAKTDHFHVVIAGPDEGETQRRLVDRAARLGIAQRVHWPGLLDGMARALFFASIDLFVLPSHSENFGLAAAEAMATGIAVVVTPGVGLSSAIAEKSAGRVVPRNAQDWAATVSELLTDWNARATMGAAGKQMVQRQFSEDTITTRMLQLYKTCA